VSNALNTATTYTVKLTTGVKALDGTPLAAPVTWQFTTGTTISPVRIQVGGTSAWSDSLGNPWTADQYYRSGITESFPTRTIANTNDQPIYRDDRVSSSTSAAWSYTIPVPNGTYTVKLHFVELTKTAKNQRVFSVDIVGTTANPDIASLDIFVAAGGANKALVKTITGVPALNNQIVIKSILGTDYPEIAGIEVIPQ
jgi:hypothetical protein